MSHVVRLSLTKNLTDVVLDRLLRHVQAIANLLVGQSLIGLQANDLTFSRCQSLHGVGLHRSDPRLDRSATGGTGPWFDLVVHLGLPLEPEYASRGPSILLGSASLSFMIIVAATT